ncbi:MAG TPA: M24 family metallopeptidase, partial [Candidatus Dormibacteraeota bacterium]|nr:M24 family metallopeptidase [Candidatus Dormibacteraeota bacterium]
MVTIKRPEEIARMRRAGAILADVLDAFRHELRPGITTAELDRMADEMIRAAGAVPSFKGYPGSGGASDFPASICASLNDEVVHGIPSPQRRVRDGDVMSLDVGCIWEGWHADCARTWAVGKVPRRVQQLI